MTAAARCPTLKAGPVLSPSSITIYLLASALITVIFIGLTSSTGTIEALAPAAAFALLAMAVIATERRRYGTFGLASPISLFTIFWFLYLGVMGVGSLGLFTSATTNLPTAAVIDGLWLAVFALVMMIGGYEVATRTVRLPVSSARRLHSDDCPQWAIITALLLGWGATIYLLDKNQIGYLQFGQTPASGFMNLIIHYAAGLVPLTLAALSAVLWSVRPFRSMSKRRARLLLLINLPPVIALSLASGLKGQLITSLLPVAIVYVLLRGRVPWKALLLVVLYLVVSFGGIQQYRTTLATGTISVKPGHGPLGPVTAALSNVATEWTSGGIVTHVTTFWNAATAEYSAVPRTIGIIMATTPTPTPYLGVRRYLAGIFFFLPTSTFQSPNFSLGSYVSVNYLGSPASTSAPPTQPGDFFMSGGATVVIVGEFSVGVLIGLLWKGIASSRSRYRATVLYAVIAVNFANAGLDFAGLLRGSLEGLVIYGSLCLVFLPRGAYFPNVASEVPGSRPTPSTSPAPDSLDRRRT